MVHSRVDRRQVLAAALALAAPGAALAAAAAAIPFELIGGKIYVPAVIGGQPVQAVLDSGSAFTGVDAGFAARAGLRPSGLGLTLRGLQGRAHGRWAPNVSLEVAGRSVRSRLLVVDYGSLAATVQHPVEALLGADFMAAYVVEIDFEGRTVAFHDRAGFRGPGGAQLVPLTPLGSVVTAPVTVEGAVVRAIVDTGSDVPLILSPGVARRVRLLEGRPVSTTIVGGLGGASQAQIAAARRVTLGSAAFDAVPVQVTARSIGAEANVGLGVLGRFRLWLDIGGRRMWLQRNGDRSAFKRDALGIYGAAEGDAIRISHVARGSPAARSGVVAGDLIAFINGERAAVANRLLTEAPPGTKLVLTMAGGQVRHVVMATYY